MAGFLQKLYDDHTNMRLHMQLILILGAPLSTLTSAACSTAGSVLLGQLHQSTIHAHCINPCTT
jgi:hypothetical protein